MSTLQITYQGTVYPWHCDHMGHMNVMWYAGKFDEASWNLLADLGLTTGYFRSEARGMAAVEQKLNYFKELVAGDVIIIRSGVLEVRDKVVRVVHQMENAVTGDIAAVALLTGVHISTQSRRGSALPDAVAKLARERTVDFELQR
jgi:acyl-CoA thioester hydrolase